MSVEAPQKSNVGTADQCDPLANETLGFEGMELDV